MIANSMGILNRRKMTVMAMNGLLHINIYGTKRLASVCFVTHFTHFPV